MPNPSQSRTLAPQFVAAGLLLASVGSALAAVRYVDVNNPNATPPYTNWTTAATNIQDAIDAAVAGDEIVVTNGIFASGGRVTVSDSTTNRVVVDKPLSLRSVNGPQSTAIDGGASVRCVCLTDGASLSGFTLTAGRAQVGGGLWCESANAVVSNCVVSGNSSVGYTISVWVGSPCCDLQQPVPSAGGVYGGTLYDCTLSGNRAETHSFTGFPCDYSTCTGVGRDGIETYYWLGAGGGAANATLNNCTLSANWAAYGGGAYGCTLNNCTLTGNTAAYRREDGQGYGGGGGAYHSVLNNCIVNFNTAADGPNYDSDSILNYCCTTPQPAGGTGNISADPQLASSSHLSANSPCREAGSTAYASGTDIDGETWAGSPSIGCDEYHPGAVTGPLSVGITATVTNVVEGFTVQFTALNEGRITASSWDFGDGTTATNQPFTSHMWSAPGNYAVVLRAYNESHPAGISTTLTVHLGTAVHYVATGSPNPLAPYTSWATAATNIQDAIDVAVAGDEIVVTNGIYATGARVTVSASNRVVVDKPLIVRSINGPQFTTVDGDHSMRCVYLTKGASLSGFTLMNGGFANGPQGGGVFGESVAAVVSNCTLSGNVAYFGGGAAGCTLNRCILTENVATGYSRTGDSCVGNGGGAYKATLNNCTLTGNRSCQGGGADSCVLNNCVVTGNSGSGASGCTLNNCTLTGNSAYYGSGGAVSSTLNNCVVYFNTAPQEPNYDGSSTLNYSCTTPLPTNGVGNFTHEPVFVDTNGWANLRLQPTSPCINAGNNAYAPGGTDADGKPRIVQGTVDIGAYEFQRTVRYVDVNSANATPPYTSWTIAATNIQDAADAAVAGDAIVVADGNYAFGGRATVSDTTTNRVAVDKPLSVGSINGPLVTTIDGGQSNRCVYLTDGASLSGFTLSNGVANYGGGVYCESTNAMVSNCALLRNQTSFPDDRNPLGFGGGAYRGTLNNCTLTGNSARAGGGNGNAFGGGAWFSILNNCTLVGNSVIAGGRADGGGAYGCILTNCTLTANSASSGGGASFSTLNNCIVYWNTAGSSLEYDSSCTLNYCCTTPQPGNGFGNITNAPSFVDEANGNLRLQSNSPCINAGLNSFATAGPDLDGHPRIKGGTVDIGAYEFQAPDSIISYAWLQQYNLPTDGSADTADPDGDGLNNWREWRCGTDPMKTLSVLRLLTPVTGGTNVLVTWPSVAGVNYFLERATNLTASPAFTPLATNIPGQPGTTTYTDTNALGARLWFYRVGVGD